VVGPAAGIIQVHLSGLSDYVAVRDLQRRLVERRIAGAIPDVVLLLEHADVLTVGRARGARGHIVAPGDVPVVEVERGGDVTWHGPGQLVAYPIVALEGERRDLHRHLRALEDAMIRVLAGVGLTGIRDPRNSGVWLAGGEDGPRKVGSVGIACRRWVTWHGLALNVDPDRAGWSRLRPCGFEPETMTLMAEHGATSTVTDLVAPMGKALARALGLACGPMLDVTDPARVEAELAGHSVNGRDRTSPRES
jgi:lipoyl(octanoyl) transferase